MMRRAILQAHQLLTGRKILHRFDELMQTQWLSWDELYALQQERLYRLVDYAYRYVPYYQRVFREIDFHPLDLRRDPANFYRLPLLTKEEIRANWDQFLTTEPQVRRQMVSRSTSGSTGEPFVFLVDHQHRDYTTADYMRHLTWCGWQIGTPYTYMAGQKLDASLKERLRNSLMNFTLNFSEVDAYDLVDESLDSLVRQLRRRGRGILGGFPSALYVLARFVQESGVERPDLLAVRCGGEVLFPKQRRLIEETFGCRVFNWYGSYETGGGAACECEAHTGLHVSMEKCLLEILRQGRPVEGEESGEVVVTNLINFGFPFIRYRLKDEARWLVRECPCGRQSPMIAPVTGRTVELFRTVDGRVVVSDINEFLFEAEGVRQFQIVQKALDLIVVRIVRDERFDPASLDKITGIIQQVMGRQTQVKFEFPDEIPAGRTGKQKYSYSELEGSQPWE